ncbi:MAG: glycosyltransferase, partial [Terrimicrobiaceae bacterium]|nr:glycosyltransferase [Terrimicrobiaceae bacterium]
LGGGGAAGVVGMSAPFFSVITPSFNQAAYLGECLRSVEEQGGADWEHLVFDNCSSDGSAEVAARFARVRWVSEPDRGQSHAVNKGFAAARGEVVCWLNSDDAYPPGLFVRLRSLFADPATQVVFGDVEQRDEVGGPGVAVGARFHNRLDLVRWWRSDARLHQPAVFFRREVRERTGFLCEDLHFAMDYEYWWRMSELATFRHVPEVLAIQHRQPESKTVRSWHRVCDERERVFSPFYHLVDGGDRAGLLAEMRVELSAKYLGQAFAAAERGNRRVAWESWRRAAALRPSCLLRIETLGLLRRLALARRR